MLREIFGGRGSEPLEVAPLGRSVRPEVGQHFPQARLRLRGEVERPKAAVDVVEAVAPAIELVRRERDRVAAEADSPEIGRAVAHGFKLQARA